MKNTKIFIKRNLLEMLRDPILYVMCVLFPILMFILFTIINNSTPSTSTTFNPKALTPGIMIFSYSFLALMASLIISKDRSTAFLKRLYTSPMRSHSFFLGYLIPLAIIGFFQATICLLSGLIIAKISGTDFINLLNGLLLILVTLPIMFINILIGFIIGALLNDKAAPGISSVLISSCGILGGCWMPIETMGGFFSFAKLLPFYHSVALGKVITGAKYLQGEVLYNYEFNMIGLLIILFYLLLTLLLSILSINKMIHTD